MKVCPKCKCQYDYKFDYCVCGGKLEIPLSDLGSIFGDLGNIGFDPLKELFKKKKDEPNPAK